MSLGAGTLPDGVVDAASAVPLGLALAVLALGALRFFVLCSRDTLATARLAFELVLAAGLIRLAAHHDLVTIGGVGALVLLRRVVAGRARTWAVHR